MKTDHKMNVGIYNMLQAISVTTPDIAVEYSSEKEFSIDHTLLRISDDELIRFNGTILRINDPRDFLYEFRAEKVLKISFEQLKLILRTYHKLERNERRNKKI
jgi:hypothetical protein